eukprot:TRINITY_DN26987_c0_g3_i1.p1 TRINITY_DN26987_c0_g3~~TRINITY_DN26987_c0_g3_i1.p1  ORF type:complete len:447 (+),score=57.97 TRINITY_DN26987_c0_g3_i1:71-1411(+)
MAERSATWQEEMSTTTWLGFTAVGFVPLVGPTLHCGVNLRNGCYKLAALNATCAFVDMWSLGSASAASQAASSASAARTSFSEVTKSALGNVVGMKVHEVVPKTLPGLPGMLTAHGVDVAFKTAKEAALRNALNTAAEAAKHAEKVSQVAEAVKTTSVVVSSVAKFVRGGGGLLEAAQTAPYEVFGETCPSTIANVHVPGSLATPWLTPAEGDGRAFIPIEKQPRRTLTDSNFCRFYTTLPRRPSLPLLRSHLQGRVLRTFDACLADQNGHIGQAAARVWSYAAPAHYKAINNALMADNAALLRHWTPLIRVLNNYMLSFHLLQDTTTRRKSWLSRSEALAYRAGQTYRFGMYCATSRKAWHEFPQGVGGPDVRWEFTIPRGCFQACDIEQASLFGASEREVLLVPFAPVTIDRHDICPATGVVTIFATLPRDGKALSDSLATIMA